MYIFLLPREGRKPKHNCNSVLGQEAVPSINQGACCKGVVEKADKIIKSLLLAWKDLRALYREQKCLKLQPNEENRKRLISLGRFNIKKHNEGDEEQFIDGTKATKLFIKHNHSRIFKVHLL